jgi:hypothetical protein
MLHDASIFTVQGAASFVLVSRSSSQYPKGWVALRSPM